MWKYLSHLLAFVTCKTTACIFSVLFHFVWQKKAFLFRKLDFTGYLQPSLAVTISFWCVIRWICIEKKMIYYSSIFTFTFIASFRTNLETVCAHNIYILFIAKSNCSLWLCIFSMLGLKTYHFCLYYTKLATLIMTFLKLSSHQKYTGSISIVDLLASHVCNGAFSLIRTHKKFYSPIDKDVETYKCHHGLKMHSTSTEQKKINLNQDFIMYVCKYVF